MAHRKKGEKEKFWGAVQKFHVFSIQSCPYSITAFIYWPLSAAAPPWPPAPSAAPWRPPALVPYPSSSQSADRGSHMYNQNFTRKCHRTYISRKDKDRTNLKKMFCQINDHTGVSRGGHQERWSFSTFCCACALHFSSQLWYHVRSAINFYSESVTVTVKQLLTNLFKYSDGAAHAFTRSSQCWFRSRWTQNYKIAFIFYPKTRDMKALVLLEFFVAPESALRSPKVTLSNMM